MAITTLSVSTALASPWPVGINDEATALYREPTWIPVLENDIGDNLFIASVNTTSKYLGKVSINDDRKSVTFTSSNAREDEFWYVLEDDQGRTNAAKVTLSVSDIIWPTGSNDTAEATYEQVITISVLENDLGTELKLISVNEWSSDQGKAWIEGNQLKYQQVGVSRGDITDEFWYVFEDKWGRKNAAKVVVSVSDSAVETNPYPVATPDFATASELVKVFIPVLENDSGTDLSLKETNAWTQNGGKTVIADNVIKYSAPDDFEGTDAFWYVFEDSQGRTNSAKVEVEVTKSTQLSSVAYCGNVYQTDGTAENTTLIDQTPIVTPSDIEVLDNYVFTSGGGTVSGRTYGLNGSEETGVDLWMEVDGVSSKVTSSPAGSTMTLVGAYGDFIYFTINETLYGHDGGDITEFDDLFAGLEETDKAQTTYSISTKAVDNALYITATKFERDPSRSTTWVNSYLNTWRISDGLGATKFYVGESFSVSYSGMSTDYSTSVTNKAYFNGLDYTRIAKFDNSSPNTLASYSIGQSENGVSKNGVGGQYLGAVHNNSRFFVMTRPFFYSQYSRVDGKLYVIDKDDNFVELATCNIADYNASIAEE